jgi:uncharacterized protein YwqG
VRLAQFHQVAAHELSVPRAKIVLANGLPRIRPGARASALVEEMSYLMELREPHLSRLPSLARQYLGDSAAQLLPEASLSVRLQRTQACGPSSSGSRLGGLALLPPGQSWPVTQAGIPLSFLGQISTSEIPVSPGCPGLPPDTLLAFFYEAAGQQGWGFDPADHQYWKVIAVPLAAAAPADAPAGVRVFSPRRLVPEQVTTIPDPDEPAIEGLGRATGDGIPQLYDQLYEELYRDDKEPRHRMFGWPDLVQNSMQLDCQLASSGIDLRTGAGYDDPKAAQLEGGAAEWMLLLQVDTDDEVGWMWGDCGTLYYWIRRPDLLAGRFDRVWMIFQCC